MSDDADEWLAQRRREIDQLLDRRVPAAGDDPGRLREAVRYSLLAPGKRLRPLLALGAAEALGAALDAPVRIAAGAVELCHCYSLVHDDLPAMDDDDVRRGRPTSHKVFGEATAILAGDALLTMAFEWIAEAGAASDRPADFLRAARALAAGAGIAGMVRGQARDLAGPKPATLAALETLHREKTAALFRAALEVGAAAAGGSDADVEALGRFGDKLGVAFQHADDLNDGDHPGFAAEARARVPILGTEATAMVERFGSRAAPLARILADLVRRTAA